MLWVQRVPKWPLDRFIQSIWLCQREPGPFHLERVLPNGAAQLIVNLKEDQSRMYDCDSGEARVTVLPGVVVSGVHSRFSVIDTAEQESVAGVVFRPGGTTAFFRPPAHEMANSDFPVEALWGRSAAAEMRDRLLEARGPEAKLDTLEHVMLEMLQAPEPDRAVAFGVRALAGNAAILDIAAEAGLSQKRFIERFKAVVGMAPKPYGRLLRFQRALAHSEQGRTVDWTRVALDCGYFDQPHFIHDFRAFSGITPNMYRAARTEFRNHVKFLQSSAAAGMASSAHG
jgi:AraC-like DNA-binding protein